MAQRKDLLDARRIVEVAGIRTLIRRARLVRAIDALAERAIVRIRQHGLHARLFQRHEPAIDVLFLRVRAQDRAARFGNAGERGFIADRFAPGVRRVEHRVLEIGRELGELVGDFAEARSRRLFERDAGETEIAQLMLDQRARRARQRRKIAGVGDGAERGVERAVLPELARVLDDLLLRGGIRIAQRLGILHAVQVRNRRPGAIEAIFELLAGEHDGGEIARSVRGEQRVDARAIVREHDVDGGFDMGRRDRRKARQTVGFEQRVRVGHGGKK